MLPSSIPWLRGFPQKEPPPKRGLRSKRLARLTACCRHALGRGVQAGPGQRTGPCVRGRGDGEGRGLAGRGADGVASHNDDTGIGHVGSGDLADHDDGDAGTHGYGVGRGSLELPGNRRTGAGSGQNQFRYLGAHTIINSIGVKPFRIAFINSPIQCHVRTDKLRCQL